MTIRDDLDGSEGAATVTFGLDGVAYEIDLGESNRTTLKESLAPFIEAGRLAKKRARRSGADRPGSVSVDRAAVRAWARAAGMEISERGRISTEVLRQYEAAH